MKLERGPEVKLPQLPMRPGRGAYSKRTRLILAVTLAATLVVALVVAAFVSTSSTRTPARSVTIPLADRNASPALLRAAEAVGFHPIVEPGIGELETESISAANPPSTSSLLPVGTPAPGFALRTPTGVKVSLDSLRGKAVLLELFATWCPHCGAEAPYLEKLYASLPHSRYAFLSINADGEDAASVLAYHIYFGLQFPALLDPSSRPGSFASQGARGPVTMKYRLSVFPTFYVLDRRGRIAWRGDGEQPDVLLLRELRQAARS